MKNLIPYLFILLSFLYACSANLPEEMDYAIIIHGGAGNMNPENLDKEKSEEYLSVLEKAIDHGSTLLKEGKSSVDVVEEVIQILEDSPLFNAGKGAVFTHEGRNELDASIMEGKNMNAGAVAGITNVKNPISAARKVMEKSEHVMLSGNGANEFAAIQGLEIVDPSYFHTDERYNSLLRTLRKESEDYADKKMKKMGTVGCVALDKNGNLCAGTSTGGMGNKRYGRIGDSPVIGAGTYANNATCGVSCTGHGEFFIRYSVAHDISALMEYRNLRVEEAAEYVIQEKLLNAGGSGGVICLDNKGNYSMEFNTEGMFRAYANSKGEKFTAVYGKE